MNERVPMYHREVEMSAIGVCLLSDRALDEVCSILSVRDFHFPSHKLIFKAIKDLNDDHKPVDQVSLEVQLGSELPNIGGGDYLLEIGMYVPSASNSAYYAGEVLNYSKRRQAFAAARRIAIMSETGEEIEAIMSEARSIGEHLSFGGNMVPDVDTRSLAHKVLHGVEGQGVHTFIPSIDRTYCARRGGAATGQVTLFQAPRGEGKSTAMLSTIFPALMKNEPCVFMTFADLDADEIMYRAIRFVSGFAGRLSECRDEHDRKAVMDAADVVHSWPWWIYDSSKSHGGTSIEAARTWLMRHCDKHGTPTRVGMDYAQRISTSNPSMMVHQTTRNQYVSEKMRNLASEIEGAAFFVGCQVTKKDDEFVSKHSTDWEEDAALVIQCFRAAWKLTKNRHGVDRVEIPMYFDPLQLMVKESFQEQ